MSTPTNEPTQFERSPEFFVAEVAHRWISQIQRGPEDEIHIGKGQKIDPEKGILHEILEIRVSRKMERVDSEPTTKLEPLPPIPMPRNASMESPLAPVVTPQTT